MRPLKTIELNENIKYQPEWLTSEILDLMKERNKQKLNGNNDAYKALRNKVSALIDVAKKETYRNEIEEGKSDPRTIWKLLREFGLKYNDCNNSKFSLKSDDKMITNEADMAGIFNNFFINIASKLKEPTLKADFEELKNFVGNKVPNCIEFKIPLTNHAFIRQFLSKLNANKSTALDNIGPRILKMSANIIVPSILFILNKSITSG